MDVSIKYFDTIETAADLDEKIDELLTDKDIEIYIPELDKHYTSDEISISQLRLDIIDYYTNGQGISSEYQEPPRDPLKSANRLGKFFAILMFLGAVMSLLAAFYCIDQSAMLGLSCLVSAVILLIAGFFTLDLVQSLDVLKKRITVLEEKIQNNNNEDSNI